MELEAESVAYFVGNPRGITANSQGCLANHVSDGTSLAGPDRYELTKVAGQMEDALGIAAHSLFAPESRANRKQQLASQPAPQSAQT
jgi:hypothetical protein